MFQPFLRFYRGGEAKRWSEEDERKFQPFLRFYAGRPAVSAATAVNLAIFQPFLRFYIPQADSGGTPTARAFNPS